MFFISSFILFLSKVFTVAHSFILQYFVYCSAQILPVCVRNISAETKQWNIHHQDNFMSIKDIFETVF
jgi:hypothetical protein